MYKRYLSIKGLIDFDDSWGYHFGTVPSEDRFYCDWTGVEGLDLPDCYEMDVLPGHRGDDVLSFNNFLGLGDAYTNVEFFEWLSPDNSDIPYIYDNFDYSFCSSQGYAIYE